uniref:Uncharacterized protein n=1 Tax=Anguilla anguilla TaxID=7936 RepID=A0A0E9RMM4_ANGAN
MFPFSLILFRCSQNREFGTQYPAEIVLIGQHTFVCRAG